MLVDIEIKPIGEYPDDPFGDPNSDRVWAIRRGKGLYESVMMDQYLSLLGQQKGLGYRKWWLNQPFERYVRDFYDKYRDLGAMEGPEYEADRTEMHRQLRFSSAEYGIADSVKQVLQKHRVIFFDPRPFVLSFYRLTRPVPLPEPLPYDAYGPWYGRKDGEYIGKYKREEDIPQVVKWSLSEVPEELVIR